MKQLIEKFGKEKINTFTKYPSILTLHKFGEKGVFTDEFTTEINPVDMYATEKIDGTNVRIIIYKDKYLIGSREFILHYCDDLYFDPSMGIVESLRALEIKIPYMEDFTVIYGELYGGRVSSNSKWYGQDKVGFRIFDVAVYKDFTPLDLTLDRISGWREKETPDGIIYGQNFLNREQLMLMKGIHQYWKL